MKRNLYKYLLLFSVLGFGSVSAQAVALKLNQPVADFSSVDFAAFAANNTRVVYLLSTNNAQRSDLYSVPVNGGTPINLTQTTGNKFFPIGDIKISPDGTRVFYTVDNTPTRFDVFSVPVDGSSLPVQLSSINVNGGAVQEYVITPDGESIIYIADQIVLNQDRLFIASTTQSLTSTEIQLGLAADRDVDSVDITPDGSTIVYEADFTAANRVEFFKIPVGGGQPVSLSGPVVPGGGNSTPNFFRISPTGSRIAFRLDKEVPTKNEFYSVSITGNTPPVKLNGPLDPTEDAATGGAVFSPDGNRILFLSQEAPDGNRNLFNVASDNPSDRRQVNPNFDNASKQVLPPSIGQYPGFAWNTKGDRIVYIADQFQASVFRLFSTSVNGGPIVTLTDEFIVNGSVRTFAVVPNGRAVLYIANKENVGKIELYFAPIRGGRNVKVSDPIIPAADVNIGVNRFVMSSDSRYVAYTSTQEDKDRLELYITNIPIARDATADFDGDFVNDILLKKGRALRILTRNNPTNTFEFKNLLTLLPKKHKVLASKDINADNRPELILKKGKKPPFALTVTANLALTNTGIKLPSVDKKFKIQASGYIDTNTVIVASKRKTMRVYYTPYSISTNTTNVIATSSNFIERINPKGFKVVGFGSYNEEPAVILRKKKQYSAIAINTLSNGFAFGTITTNIGNLPKKFKGFAAAPYLEEINPDLDIVIRRGKQINLLDLLAGSTNTYPAKTLIKSDRRFKIIGPK